MKLLALDFDGVISDSAPEAFTAALRTFVALRPGSALVALRPGSALASVASPLAGARAPALEGVRASRAWAPFLEMMPLGNRAEDYGVVLAAIEADLHLADQAAYDVFRATQRPDWLHAFHQRFYREREAMRAADADAWHALMGPYPTLPEVLRRHASDVTLAIATAKDRRSVRALLRAYGMDDLFDDDRVLDKETGVSKTAHLRTLRRRFDVSFDDMVFVDDKVNHLDSVASLGARCGLACWGYNGQREARIARERGYLLCRLEALEAQLFPDPPAR
jgi:phosphoglycolate phosphatase-like HAD superfamily hydrolase